MRQMTELEFVEACNRYGHSWSSRFEVSWTTGGTYGNCWNDQLMPVSPSAPEELTSLDDFLTEYFPNITFMQYRNIINAVDTTETREGDYYGGCIYGICKTLSFGNLQDKLERLGLLEIITADVE